jgi:hypothetical protein
MVFIFIPEWVQKAEEELKDTIRKITLKNKLNYHLVRDSKTIDDSIKSICSALQQIPEDRDMVEAEKYFKKQKNHNDKN